MVASQGQTREQDLFFTPTLVIGLGGTGQRVVRRLKQKVNATFTEYPVMRFLAFDTDTRDNPPDEAPLDERELCLIAGYNPADVLRDLDLPGNAPIRERLNGTIKLQSVNRLNTFVHIGAQQNRIVSLIGLYQRFGMVHRHLQGAVEEILSMAKTMVAASLHINGFRARVTPATEAGFPFRVFVVCSLGGGTGSGLFVDFAYLCRYLLRGHIAQVHGIFVLPAVIDLMVRRVSTVQRNRIRANTYAAFKELDALQESSRWNFAYPDSVLVDEATPPYDFCYLIDKENEHGQGFTQAEAIWDNAAQALFDCISPTIGGHLGTFYGNTEILTHYFPGHGDAQNRDSRDRRQGYSSFISGSISLPLQRLQDYCGTRLAMETLGHGQPPTPEETADILDRNSAFLTRVLDVKTGLELLTAGLSVPAWGGPPQNHPDTSLAQAAQQENLDRVFLQSAERAIHDRQQAITRKTTEELRTYADTLRRAVGGEATMRALNLLSGAEPVPAPILANLRCSLRDLSKAVERNAVAAASQAYKAQRMAVERLAAAGITGILRRTFTDDRKRRAIIGSMIAARERRVATEIDAAARAALSSVYTRLAEEARTLNTSMEIVSIAMGHCRNHLQEDRQALERGDPIPGSPILEPPNEMGVSVLEVPHLERVYLELTTDANTDQARNDLRELLGKRSLEDFGSLARGATEARDLATRFRRICSEIYRGRLHHLDVMDFMTQPHADRPSQDVVGEAIMDIRKRAVPLWRYDRNRLCGELEHMAIIAVADAQDPRIPEWMRDPSQHFQVRSTNIRWRVDLLHIRHGVPVGLLYDASEWRQTYEQALKSAVPLHIMPFDDLPDIIPPEVAPRVFGGERAFALGMALGWIAKIGTNRYYFDPDSMSRNLHPLPERLLANGRGAAMEALSRNPAWVAEMGNRLEKLTLTEGQPSVIAKLEKAIAELETELRRVSPASDMAAQYRKEMTLLIQAVDELKV